MDPIRPIGPPERDIDPVVRITRSSPDPERRERREEAERRDPADTPRRQPQPSTDMPPLEGSGGLIDIKV